MLVRAASIIPMDAPPIRDGAIVFTDRIIQLGADKALRASHPDADVVDRGDCTVLPGLINAHTHVELSMLSRGERPGSFADWLWRLIPRGPVDVVALQESAARGAEIGASQSLKFGVTCVGDISRHCAVTRPILRGGPLRVVSFGEVAAMGQRRHLLDERLAAARDQTFASASLRIGITPHAPYSVEAHAYRACLQAAQAGNLPLATHLAETPAEAEFLQGHCGPFRDIWNELGIWDDQIPRFGGGPIRFARSLGLLDYPTLLAHVNYCDDEELRILAAGRASVVYCPRTHAWFRHPPHRWRQMLAAGINVALGTDSCASSPDLNLLDDLRLVRRAHPDVPAHNLFELITTRAARALRMHDQIGSLMIGKQADFVLFPADSPGPLAQILEANLQPQEVWIGGQRLAK